MVRKVSNDRHVADVVSRLYADAAKLDWEYLSVIEKSAQYAAWLDADEVWGLLGQWMSREEARVWIKDGPMKEYARALAGVGAFAEYLDDHPRGPQAMVAATLGDGWTVVPDSEGGKPLHCDAMRETSTVRLIWGPSRDFKHLLWAGLDASDRLQRAHVRIAVFDTLAHPTSRAAKNKQQRFCHRCGLEISHVRLGS